MSDWHELSEISEQRQLKWDRRFLSEALSKASWSKDPSTKTGCVITRGFHIICTGYNGFPQGVQDNEDRYNNRELKYKLIEHCDRNAIYQAARYGISLEGSTMYLTGPPCAECTRGIIQSGIIRVVWPKDNKFETTETWERWKESCELAFMMMVEAGS